MTKRKGIFRRLSDKITDSYDWVEGMLLYELPYQYHEQEQLAVVVITLTLNCLLLLNCLLFPSGATGGVISTTTNGSSSSSKMTRLMHIICMMIFVLVSLNNMVSFFWESKTYQLVRGINDRESLAKSLESHWNGDQPYLIPFDLDQSSLSSSLPFVGRIGKGVGGGGGSRAVKQRWVDKPEAIELDDGVLDHLTRDLYENDDDSDLSGNDDDDDDLNERDGSRKSKKPGLFTFFVQTIIPLLGRLVVLLFHFLTCSLFRKREKIRLGAYDISDYDPAMQRLITRQASLPSQQVQQQQVPQRPSPSGQLGMSRQRPTTTTTTATSTVNQGTSASTTASATSHANKIRLLELSVWNYSMLQKYLFCFFSPIQTMACSCLMYYGYKWTICLAVWFTCLLLGTLVHLLLSKFEQKESLQRLINFEAMYEQQLVLNKPKTVVKTHALLRSSMPITVHPATVSTATRAAVATSVPLTTTADGARTVTSTSPSLSSSRIIAPSAPVLDPASSSTTSSSDTSTFYELQHEFRRRRRESAQEALVNRSLEEVNREAHRSLMHETAVTGVGRPTSTTTATSTTAAMTTVTTTTAPTVTGSHMHASPPPRPRQAQQQLQPQAQPPQPQREEARRPPTSLPPTRVEPQQPQQPQRQSTAPTVSDEDQLVSVPGTRNRISANLLASIDNPPQQQTEDSGLPLKDPSSLTSGGDAERKTPAKKANIFQKKAKSKK